MSLEDKLSCICTKIRDFSFKARENPSRLLNYLASYGGATFASYAVGALSASYSKDSGCSPEIIAALSFAAKTSVFYILNTSIYTSLNWREYKKERSWRKDMDSMIISSAEGTGVTLIGGGIHWMLMRAVNMGPVLSFIIGNIIPGGSAVAVKLFQDARRGIIVR